MEQELITRSIRFNRDMLDQYVNMKLPLIKAGVNPALAPKPKENTTMTRDTLRRWVRAFSEMYVFS
jgi:hypothetical protein